MNSWKKLLVFLFVFMLVLPLIVLTGCPSPTASTSSVSPKPPKTSLSPTPPETTASSTTPDVQIFPRNVTVDLDFPVLLLYANVNSQSIKAYSDKYNVEWFCNNVLISTESSLTEKPFINAIGNVEGVYNIGLVVRDKATGDLVGADETTVTAKKDKPIIIAANHWVSATPGQGLKMWNATGTGVDWWGYDVDLRIQGTTGTLITTTMTFSPTVPEEFRTGAGLVTTTSIKDIKDDGTNIEFSFITGTSSQIIITYKLSRTADGHLKGSYQLNDAGGETWGEGDVQGVSLPQEWIGTVDLVPAP